ncbi:MAG: hypothetical protein Athens101410_353 [Parcubacteria group bacterium Athens1014_10]|nr:MAG: hypothetical protein Athens101410_353 [Parcubacteria group bacterium Athens1014_10]TSD05169.1 MAG: hypothetical protein Athens071412_471 [Parcubacteria group bacterium Athens0714_12]
MNNRKPAVARGLIPSLGRTNYFLKTSQKVFFHIPLNMGQVIIKNIEKIKNAGAFTPESLMLFDDKSLWGFDIYIAVSKEIKKMYFFYTTRPKCAKTYGKNHTVILAEI